MVPVSMLLTVSLGKLHTGIFLNFKSFCLVTQINIQVTHSTSCSHGLFLIFHFLNSKDLQLLPGHSLGLVNTLNCLPSHLTRSLKPSILKYFSTNLSTSLSVPSWFHFLLYLTLSGPVAYPLFHGLSYSLNNNYLLSTYTV